MNDRLSMWDDENDDSGQRLRPFSSPITIVARHVQRSPDEFAEVELTAYPAATFSTEDSISCRAELLKLDVDWPNSFISGLMEALTDVEKLAPVGARIVLTHAAYHDIDSTRNAFRAAGFKAGRKILEEINSSRRGER
jgi:hypothetical protein